MAQRRLRRALLVSCLLLAVAAGQEGGEQTGGKLIIPSAGEPDDASVTDLDPSGDCKPDAATFCKGVRPGAGRLTECVTKQLLAERKGNAVGRMLTEDCKAALQEYKIHRNKNINLDVPLAMACKVDVQQLCANVTDDDSSGGNVAYCLRQWGNKLSQGCKREVIRTMLEASDDYRLDPHLEAACSDAVAEHCAAVEPGEGREVECLSQKHSQLSWACLQHVLAFQKQAANDIRLNLRLFRLCFNDQRKFCPEVEPGHMRVQDCLEDHIDAEGFSPGCREGLDEAIRARVANFSMDDDMRAACAADIKATCATDESAMSDPQIRQSVRNCLQSFKADLKSPECSERVQRQMMRAARSIDFNDVLAQACGGDRAKLCPGVQPGSARVIRCLQDSQTALSQTCAAALFDHEVHMAESIDFKYPMKRACAWEIATFCREAGSGHGRVVRCLQQQLQHEDMSRECKAEVARDANRAAQDYRLNWRLKHACEQDVAGLCRDSCPQGTGQPCGGLVLQCLTERQANLSSEACKEEVFYYQLMGVTDFRNDVILAEACRADVDKYCKDVVPGEGRVHTCLRHNLNFISEACRAQEDRLAAAELRDIRLKPKLAMACARERAAFCGGVKPGRQRVIKCLIERMGEPTFGADCRLGLQQRAAVVTSDYRYDVGVRDACGPAADTLCADAKAKLRGNAEVLKCLVAKYDQAPESCQVELSRAVRHALWDFAAGSPLTAACNADVDKYCPKNAARRPGGAFGIGAAGRCLAKALAQRSPLAPDCRALVLAAAPRGSRGYLAAAPEGAGALVATVAGLQRAAGLEGVLVDPYVARGSGVTVTGWAALACLAALAAVAAAAVLAAYRRAAGLDKPGAQYLKSGDA